MKKFIVVMRQTESTSRELQTFLFSLGVTWNSGSVEVLHSNKNALLVEIQTTIEGNSSARMTYLSLHWGDVYSYLRTEYATIRRRRFFLPLAHKETISRLIDENGTYNDLNNNIIVEVLPME